MGKLAKGNKETKKHIQSPFIEYWTRKNYFTLFGGIAVLIIGYLLMSQSPWDGLASLTLSPIILLIGYLIIIPLAIMIKSSFFKK